MRYSTLQEQEYRVDLPQSQLSNETNETIMADINNVESRNNSFSEEGSVVSNLPLLFANGHPTSLEKITLAQLERFVTFMVQCSLGHDTTEVISEPLWWPKEVKFSNPLTRPKRANENWMANLKKLVFRCYTYHRSEYLLRFCSYLARYSEKDLEYVNNWDSTTSLYHKNTGKLLVTFRNENMNYDRRYKSRQKKLLSCSGVTSCYSNKLKQQQSLQQQQQQQQQHSIMLVEPPTEDIYLCDNCDAEFVGLEKMKEHELVCYEQEHGRDNSRPVTPDLSTAEPELTQDQFLEYFQLCSVNTESKTIETNNGATVNQNIVRRTSRRVRGSINFTRCTTIPFSSPAGILLAKRSKAMTEETQQERLERIERHLIAPVLSSSCRPKWLEAEVDQDRWIVTHKPNREKPAYDYVHEYKFVNSVKRKPMLSIQSQLLYVICRPVYVVLTRLTEEQINDLKRDPPQYQCLVQNISVDDKETMTENHGRERPNISSKRKAPSDENDFNMVEENEKVVSSETNMGNLINCKTTNSCNENDAILKSIKRTALCTKSSDTVAVIDLCSSDEEENPSTPAPSDENKDTMNCITENTTKSILQKFSSTKFHLKSHICSAEEKGEWLSSNVLNDSNENCTDKYGNTMWDTNTNLSPIFRPAP